MVAEELNARNNLDIASSFSEEIPANVAEQRNAKDKDELLIDHVAAHWGNLLFDNSTRFAKHTKGERMKKVRAGTDHNVNSSA
jgi:hypothetical protein